MGAPGSAAASRLMVPAAITAVLPGQTATDADKIHEIVGVQLQAPAAPLLVLLAYAVLFGFLGRRFFRWE